MKQLLTRFALIFAVVFLIIHLLVVVVRNIAYPLENGFDWALVRGVIIGIAVGIILPLVEKLRSPSSNP